MLDGILFTGPLSFKRNQDLHQWTRLRVVIRMNMVCSAGFLNMFDVYCLHKFSKYIPYKLSIEKQRSVVDARGLDLQNDI